MLHDARCAPVARMFLLAGLVVLACFPVSAKVTRHDVIIMKNGDHKTGEVKKLENGVLYIATDYFSGSIGLDWLQVAKVESTAGFQIVLKDGNRTAGTIQKVSEEEAPGKDFEIHAPAGEVHASSPDVVSIESQKKTFWRQLSGALDFGVDFTSGNNQTALTSDASANYLTTRWMDSVSFTSSFSGQSGGSQSNLVEFQTLDGLFMSKNSFLAGLGDFLHSSQQNLALRTTLGGGYGRFFLRTNHNTLVWLAGSVYTHEDFQSGQPSDQNVEANAGRIRSTTKTTFSVKLVNNFHTDFSFWDNFDSRPPNNSRRNDLGISNSIGWTF
jgi:hypothetical protein